jgi:rhamnulose-1-phosphate aldolase
MPNPEPGLSLNEILTSIGKAGQRLSAIGACEGAAGNISLYLRCPIDLSDRFPDLHVIDLPLAVPALAGGQLVATGSGCRLRDIADNPDATLGILSVLPGGTRATLHTSHARSFERLTGELNSHLAVHNDHVARTGADAHALAHAQPPYLVYLSHIPAYRDRDFINSRLLRWQPETILQLPTGLGIVPFLTPGSNALMQATVEQLREHALALWCKHGVMARADSSLDHAVDLIEYVEAAAHYEYLDLAAGSPADGLTPDELQAISDAFNS